MPNVLVIADDEVSKLEGLLTAISTFSGESTLLHSFDEENTIYDFSNETRISARALADLVPTLNLVDMHSTTIWQFMLEAAWAAEIDPGTANGDGADAEIDIALIIGKQAAKAAKARFEKWQPMYGRKSSRATGQDDADHYLDSVYNNIEAWVRHHGVGDCSTSYLMKAVRPGIDFIVDLDVDGELQLGESYIRYARDRKATPPGVGSVVVGRRVPI